LSAGTTARANPLSVDAEQYDSFNMSFSVPAPKSGKRPGLLRLLAILHDNPLGAWTAEHFERPIVRDRLPFMSAIVVSDPTAVQRVLLENAANYRKDDLLLRILSPALSNGLLTVDGEQWRRQRRAVAPMFSRRAIDTYAGPMKDVADALVRRWLGHPDGWKNTAHKCASISIPSAASILSTFWDCRHLCRAGRNGTRIPPCDSSTTP
jgi:cytochrome P450